jgi:hypothetical protein
MKTQFFLAKIVKESRKDNPPEKFLNFCRELCRLLQRTLPTSAEKLPDFLCDVFGLVKNTSPSSRVHSGKWTGGPPYFGIRDFATFDVFSVNEFILSKQL